MVVERRNALFVESCQNSEIRWRFLKALSFFFLLALSRVVIHFIHKGSLLLRPRTSEPNLSAGRAIIVLLGYELYAITNYRVQCIEKHVFYTFSRRRTGQKYVYVLFFFITTSFFYFVSFFALQLLDTFHPSRSTFFFQSARGTNSGKAVRGE